MSSQKEDKNIQNITRPNKNRVAPNNFRKQFEEKEIRPSTSFGEFCKITINHNNAETSFAINLVLEDGEEIAIEYTEIQGRRFKPSDSTIILQTPTLSITIEGKNLQAVYHYILEHRLVEITAPDNSFGAADNIDKPVVTKITIDEK